MLRMLPLVPMQAINSPFRKRKPITEGNVTKRDWDNMTDDEKETALLSAYKDPDDALEHIDKTWEQLPSVATSNMRK